MPLILESGVPPPQEISVFCSEGDLERLLAGRVSSGGGHTRGACCLLRFLFGIHCCTDLIGSSVFSLCCGLKRPANVTGYKLGGAPPHFLMEFEGGCDSKGWPCCLFPVCTATFKVGPSQISHPAALSFRQFRLRV